jgi:hypothetical protein
MPFFAGGLNATFPSNSMQRITASVRKPPVLAPLFTLKRSFYQARLGTNMGKALKNRLFSVGLEGAGELRARIHRPVSCGAKNASF